MPSHDPKLAAALRAGMLASGKATRRSPLGALGALVLAGTIAFMVAVVLMPVVAPQATCDALAPILGCNRGATPSCTLVASGVGRRSGQGLSVQCPEGTVSAAPIYIATTVVALVSLGACLTFVVARVRRRRAAL